MDRFHHFQKAQVNKIKYSIIGTSIGVLSAIYLKQKQPANFLAFMLMGYTVGNLSGDFVAYKGLNKVVSEEERKNGNEQN